MASKCAIGYAGERGHVVVPPYSPELNPVENLWDDLREKSFGNIVFDSLDALETHLEAALRNFELQRDRVKSIVAWSWIMCHLLIRIVVSSDPNPVGQLYN